MNPEKFLSYSQSSGELLLHDGKITTLLAKGWAGNHEGKNNPGMQSVRGLGPLPRGWYSIGEPFTHRDCGPYCLRLSPDSKNIMFGRVGFLIHGASTKESRYGQESRGCIILNRDIRVKIHELSVKRLQVVE